MLLGLARLRGCSEVRNEWLPWERGPEWCPLFGGCPFLNSGHLMKGFTVYTQRLASWEVVQGLEMNDCHGKEVQNGIPCLEIVPFWTLDTLIKGFTVSQCMHIFGSSSSAVDCQYWIYKYPQQSRPFPLFNWAVQITRSKRGHVCTHLSPSSSARMSVLEDNLSSSDLARWTVSKVSFVWRLSTSELWTLK